MKHLSRIFAILVLASSAAAQVRSGVESLVRCTNETSDLCPNGTCCSTEGFCVIGACKVSQAFQASIPAGETPWSVTSAPKVRKTVTVVDEPGQEPFETPIETTAQPGPIVTSTFYETTSTRFVGTDNPFPTDPFPPTEPSFPTDEPLGTVPTYQPPLPTEDPNFPAFPTNEPSFPTDTFPFPTNEPSFPTDDTDPDDSFPTPPTDTFPFPTIPNFPVPPDFPDGVFPPSETVPLFPTNDPIYPPNTPNYPDPTDTLSSTVVEPSRTAQFPTSTITRPVPTSDVCGKENNYRACPKGQCCALNGTCGSGAEFCATKNCFYQCWSPFYSQDDIYTPTTPDYSLPTQMPFNNTAMVCGPAAKNIACPEGSCCSVWNYCGVGLNYCAPPNCLYQCRF